MNRREGAFFVGRDPRTGTDVGVNGRSHLLCYARNQGGKGSGIIIPNLLRYGGSVLCTDPGLENANITARAVARRGAKVVVLDPFEQAAGPAAQFRGSFNPMAEVDPDAITFKEDLWAIAEGCIADPPHKSDNSEHFVNGARDLLMGAIAHVRMRERPEHQNLVRVRERIAREGRAVFAEMLTNEDGFGAAKEGAQRLFEAGENEGAGFMSTLLSETRWIGSEVMRNQLTTSSFRMAEFHGSWLYVYFGLPGVQASYHRNWQRTVVNPLMVRLGKQQGRPPKTGHPVLFMLDEFGNIGHLERIDRHLGELRHSNIKLAVFLQGMDQLKKDYPNTWQGFEQNCTVCAFGINDVETAQHISKSLGDRIFYEAPLSISVQVNDKDGISGSINSGPHRYREAYWSPEEVMRFLAPETRRMLLLTRPRPALLERVPYWELFRKGAYDANPKYR